MKDIIEPSTQPKLFGLELFLDQLIKLEESQNLPSKILKGFQSSYKTEAYREITSKDSRRWNKNPKNLTK